MKADGSFINILLGLIVMFSCLLLWANLKKKMAYRDLNEGIRYIQGKKYLEAIECLENAGYELKYDAKYWFYLSLAYTGAGDSKKGKKAIEKSLQYDSNDKLAIAFYKKLSQVK